MQPVSSEGLKETTTDTHEFTRRVTVPRSLIRSAIWEKHCDGAISTLPACFAALVKKTDAPFVTKTYNVVSSKGAFFSSKLLLAGDALAGIRPHTGGATNQAAYHCKLLEEVVQGRKTIAQWKDAAL